MKQFLRYSMLSALLMVFGISYGQDKGSTAENPMTVAEITAVAATLEEGQTTEADYYFKGKISNVKYTYDVEHGTGTFSISDDGTETDQFLVYGAYYLENKSYTEGPNISVGDEVVICGKLTNYKGTLETASKKAYLYSLNGATTATSEQKDVISVADAIAFTSALEADVESSEELIVKGIISSIKYEYSAQYGTATYNISDDGADENVFIVYGSYYFDNQKWTEGQTQIKVGDKVVVRGKVINYKGNTPEFSNKKNYLVSINGQTKPVEVEPDVPTAVSVSEALTIINALENGAKTEKEYQVKGFVVGAPDFQRKDDGSLFGNVNLNIAEEKDGSAVLTVFRAKGFENANFTEETISLIKEGDEVVFQGKLQKYVKDDVTTPELVSGYLVSVNGQTDGISTINAKNDADAPIYNLGGQRVEKATKGIYIQNGKKFVVK